MNLYKTNLRDLNNLEDVNVRILHRKIIEEKVFLKNLYAEYYYEIKEECAGKKIIEIGSGAGFLKKVISKTITTDIVKMPFIDIVCSAFNLPFKKNSIDAFFLMNTLHHFSTPDIFFLEAKRCLKKKGKLILIEPTNTIFSSFIYKNFHHEPFDLKWNYEKSKNTFIKNFSNQAIPWIIFFREKKSFLKRFPEFNIIEIKQHTPFRYLLSGGLSKKRFAPDSFYLLVLYFEKLLSPLNFLLAMFMTVKLEKNEL